MRENWLFVGNPGTGKSTLLNCLAGSRRFPSGLSYGGGLTRELQTTAVDEVLYMDTPGLADRSAEQQAAAAITQGLRMGGRFKLCFVVRLEFGRAICEDLVTIERVLDSIRLRDVPFAIVINNISHAAFTTLSARQNEFKRVVAIFNSGSYSTPHFVFIPRFDALDQADDKVIDLPREIRESFDAFPCIEIAPSVVTEIVTFGFSAALGRMEDRLDTYRVGGDELEIETERLERRRPGFWRISLMAADVITKVLITVLLA
jgi:hypothetical protein